MGENLGDTMEGKERDCAHAWAGWRRKEEEEEQNRNKGKTNEILKKKKKGGRGKKKKEGRNRNCLDMLTPLIAFSHFSTCAASYFPRRCSCKGKEGDWGALLCWGWVWEPTVGRYFKSLHVTLLILFFFWLLTSWFGREKKVTKYIAKKTTFPKAMPSLPVL